MASIRQRQGRWQARITREGHPDQVKTFGSKSEAERWARAVEAEMDKGHFVSLAEVQRTTLADIIKRYVREVTPTMKSAPEDTLRLNALARKRIASWSLANLTSSRIAAFRDERLKEVSAGTVIRELAYLSSIFNHARREWGIGLPNPVQLVRKPATPPGRNRVLTAEERQKLLAALEPIGRRSSWTKPLVVLALETAMRRGELLALRWEHINLEQRTAFLPDTKNGTARTVPLSSNAIATLRALPRSITGQVFPLKYFSADAAFKRAVARAGLTDLRFHDLRHTAISNMAERLPNIIELSAVSGHKSLAMLKRYYHVSAAELAKKLG
ncbi:site-specific integrase [Paucibacter sp. DJ1R-11]|uniref:tyrosine-type recombinase/integrase n=1 Tax=Paucibacter sp. DJ1R-11 TaxID=2893556 RepID=UPI0021E3AEC5|nr:site-specific integrase [Paucibacter sp. DJ1R-11]MCV2362489.1 site-specific integrase [Paucibacter sp. DJ1R-11]